jgi:hypothetical protein
VCAKFQVSGELKKVGELQSELRKKEDALASAQTAKVYMRDHLFSF